jgi:hypothetical protein
MKHMKVLEECQLVRSIPRKRPRTGEEAVRPDDQVHHHRWTSDPSFSTDIIRMAWTRCPVRCLKWTRRSLGRSRRGRDLVEVRRKDTGDQGCC